MNKTNIALKLLFFLGRKFITLPHFLKLIQKYFNRKILLSYDPMVPWRHHLGHMVEIFYFKKCDVNKIISSEVYKQSIFEMYN